MSSLTTYLKTHVLQPDNTIEFLGKTYRPHDIFRMVIIIGGYLLLRPYVLKMQAKFQEKDHAREIDPTEESSHAAIATRRKLGLDDEESDDEDDSWGAQLRRRQRAQAAERARLAEEENDSDDEIAEYLDKE